MTQRGAVIDIGSNTLHLLIADCHDDRVDRVWNMKVHARLGVAVAGGGSVGKARRRETAATVARFAALARREGVADILLIGTHAVRMAADATALRRDLEAAAEAPLYVLSPLQEAMLCLAGAALEPLPEPPYLLADIGGGSCDLALVDDSGVRAADSLAIGSGVLAARYLDDDPPSARRVRAAEAEVRAMLAQVDLDGRPTVPGIVVTGGSGRRLRRQMAVPRTQTQGLPVSRLLPHIEHLLAEPGGRWPEPVKDDERAAVIRAGAIILRALLFHWNAGWWRISTYGLREGALRWHARGYSLNHLPAWNPWTRPAIGA